MLEIISDTVLPALATVGGASLTAALLPRPAKGSKLSVLFKAIDVLAANWLNARNAK